MTPEMQILEAKIRALAGDVGELRARQSSISTEIEEAPRQRITRRWSEDQYNGPFAVRGIEDNHSVRVEKGPIHAGVDAWSWWPDYYQSTAYSAGHNEIACVADTQILYMVISVPTTGAFSATHFPHLHWSTAPYNTTGMDVQGDKGSNAEVWIPLALVTSVADGGNYRATSIWQIHRSGIQVYVTYENTGFGRYASLETETTPPV